MKINGKRVNANSVKMEDVDIRDFPDFSDAFASYAEFTDGTPLNDDELSTLTEVYGNDLAHESIR